MPQTISPSVTFRVDNVTPAAKPLPEWKTHLALRSLLGSDVESCCDYHGTVVHGIRYHGLLAAVHTAFSQHRPLILSPDMIWITIQQGLAHHMTLHAERLRTNFVKHQGRINFAVNISHFVKGSPENPWEEAFAGWSDMIRDHIGPALHDQLVADFSTTGPLEKAVSQVVLMDIFEKYFRYKAVGICGIPEISLEGTIEDWQRLRQKLDALTPFDMEWWLEQLRPICDEFIGAAQGQIRLEHWQNICKSKSDYGGSVINGWIAKLFPYLRAGGQGPARIRNEEWAFSTLNAPTGLSKVPFHWDTLKPGEPEGHYAMEAIGGFVGIQQNKETRALRPRIGWAVRDMPGDIAAIARFPLEYKLLPGLDIETVQSRGEVPDDAAKFLHVSNGSRLFRSGGQICFDILPFEKWQHVFGPKDDEDQPRFRKEHGGRAEWYRFCDLPDSMFLALDLQGRDIETEDARREWQALWEKWSPIRDAETKRIAEEVKQWKMEHPDQEAPITLSWTLNETSEIMAEYNAAVEAQFAMDFRLGRRRRANFVILCHPDTVGQKDQCPIIAESFSEFLTKALDYNGKYWWQEPGYIPYGDAVTRIKK